MKRDVFALEEAVCSVFAGQNRPSARNRGQKAFFMPELPEVEIVRRTLEPHLLGRSIVAVEAVWPKSLVASDAAMGAFHARRGWKISSLKRRGKLLLIELAGGGNNFAELIMAFHLKMTGQVLIKADGENPGRHTRVVLGLVDENGLKTRLFFDDMRKFGFCRVMLPEELSQWGFWKSLGPEPLEITPDDFVKCFCRPGAETEKNCKPELLGGKIKNLLMDQRIVVGVGNIYADEALFRAGVRPNAPASAVGLVRLKKLCKAVQEVLELGIAAGGSSIRDYLDANGKAGAFQEEFQVYGRKGKPCPKCGATLEHMKLAGRSTVFCPVCQK